MARQVCGEMDVIHDDPHEEDGGREPVPEEDLSGIEDRRRDILEAMVLSPECL